MQDERLEAWCGVWEQDVQSGASTKTRAFIALQGMGIAQRERVASPVSDTTIYLHGDHLGSVSAVTSSSGAILSRQAFTPWDELRAGGGDVTQTTRDYTGQLRDSTGLLYYGARYYDPALGRFASADSIVPGMASGQGGMAGTLGQDGNAALRPLTVDFHEPAFDAGLPVPSDAGRAAACRWGDVAVAAKHRVGLQPLTVTVHLLDLIPSPGLP